MAALDCDSLRLWQPRQVQPEKKAFIWEIPLHYSAKSWNTIKSQNPTPHIVLFICYFEPVQVLFCISSVVVSNVVSSIQTSFKLIL